MKRVSALSALRALMLCMAPLALWNGCFTEAGNPDEEEMTAVLRVATAREDSAGASAPDSVRVAYLALKLTGAEEYSGKARVGTLWSSGDTSGAGGRFAAFAPGDTLPAARVKSGRGLDSVVVRLRPYAGAAALALDTLRWEGFESPGYVKGTYHRGGVARRFLFALPDSLRLAPSYSRDALEAWRSAKGYRCLFLFRPRTWLANAGLDTARAYATANGDSVVVFDAARNAALHRALLYRFARSFNDARSYGVAPRVLP